MLALNSLHYIEAIALTLIAFPLAFRGTLKLSHQARLFELFWRHNVSGMMVWELMRRPDGVLDFRLKQKNDAAAQMDGGVFAVGDFLCERSPDHLEYNPDLGMSTFDWYLNILEDQTSSRAIFSFVDETHGGRLSKIWQNDTTACSSTEIIMSFSPTLQRELEEKNALLEEWAYTDQLTKLRNRRSFLAILDSEINKRDSDLALLFIDLDGFKSVNDSMGHSVGDRFIVEIATRLEQRTRDSDVVARLGGDEFVVLIDCRNQVDRETAAIIAVKRIIKEVFTEPWVHEGVTIYPQASIGIAFSRHYSGSQELITSADSAMYCAKDKEGTAFCFVEENWTNDAMDKVQLISEIYVAIARQQFILYYQPIVNLRTREIKGYEALLRWNHPTRGILPPGEFLTQLEASGKILEVTQWVVHQAAQDALLIPGDVYISVNISPSISGEDLEGIAVGASRNTAFELIEAAITQSSTLLKSLVSLRQNHGVLILVDDFMTSSSNLSRVCELEPDIVKFDRTVLDDLRPIPALINVVHSIGSATCVFEGIEPGMEGFVEELVKWGADCAQGHLFGEPKPVGAIAIGISETE